MSPMEPQQTAPEAGTELERRHLESQLLAGRSELTPEAQASVLQALHGIGRVALTELKQEALAEQVASELARETGAQVGVVLLGAGSNARLAGFSAPGASGTLPLAVGAEAQTTPRSKRRSQRSVEATDEDTQWLDRVAVGWTPRSCLAYGIESRDGVVLGRVILASGERDHFSNRDRDVVEAVVRQVAPAFENALLLEESKTAIRHRDEFLNIASHELKTPLTVLKGYALLLARRLRSGTVSVADIAGVAEELANASERLDQLVNDLLDTSRIRTERLELRLTLIDVSRLVQSVVARFRQPKTGTHDFQLELNEGLVGYWDENRIDQVLTNLLSNAVRYSPDGGLVRVSVQRVDDDVLFTVTDEGIGIPVERQGQLFEPFVRLHNDKRIVDGTGLGLYISDQIVKRHGGSVHVQSEASSGATFTVRLPMSLPDAVSEA